MKKRDRRLITPYRTSLTVCQSKDHQKSIDDWYCDAVPESTGPSEKRTDFVGSPCDLSQEMIDTSSAFYLNGEGTSKDSKASKDAKSRDKYNEIISNKTYSSKSSNPKNTVSVFGPDKKRLKNTSISKAKKWITEKKARQVKDKLRPGEFAIQLLNPPIGKIRVSILNPDGTPAMPAKSNRVRKWIEEGKVIPKRTKTGIFYVQLINEPSGRNKQDIVAAVDPGSRYTGIGVISKKAVLYGYNLLTRKRTVLHLSKIGWIKEEN